MGEVERVIPPTLPYEDDSGLIIQAIKVKQVKKRDRNNLNMKSSEEVDPNAPPRKRKRSIPSKLKPSTSTESIPLKRPRGRPPLNLSLNANGTINFAAGIRVPNKSHVRRSDTPGSSLSSEAYPASKSKLAPDSAETEVAKVVRPHAALVTQRILSRLMTEGPLSVADLVVSGPGVDTPSRDLPPRDLVQSILDVLQVTTVVVQLKLKDPKASSSVVTANNTLYAMAGVAKGPEYTELCKLAEVTRNKLLNTAAAKKRIEKLQEIAQLGSDVTPTERIQLLRAAVAEFCSTDEGLEDEPLYRAVSELTGRFSQPYAQGYAHGQHGQQGQYTQHSGHGQHGQGVKGVGQFGVKGHGAQGAKGHLVKGQSGIVSRPLSAGGVSSRPIAAAGLISKVAGGANKPNISLTHR